MMPIRILSNEDYLLARKRERLARSVRARLAKVHLRHAVKYRDLSLDPYSTLPPAAQRSLMRFNARLWRFYTSERTTGATTLPNSSTRCFLAGGAPRVGAAGGGSPDWLELFAPVAKTISHNCSPAFFGRIVDLAKAEGLTPEALCSRLVKEGVVRMEGTAIVETAEVSHD